MPSRTVHVLLNTSQDEHYRNEIEMSAYKQMETVHSCIMHEYASKAKITVNLHFVNHANLNETVNEIKTTQDLVLNLCDGSEVDGFVGPFLVRMLQQHNIHFCGIKTVKNEDKVKIRSNLSKWNFETLSYAINPQSEEITYPCLASPVDSIIPICEKPIENVKDYGTIVQQKGLPLWLIEPYVKHDEWSVLLFQGKIWPKSYANPEISQLTQDLQKRVKNDNPVLVTIWRIDGSKFVIKDIYTRHVLWFVYHNMGLQTCLELVHNMLYV